MSDTETKPTVYIRVRSLTDLLTVVGIDSKEVKFLVSKKITSFADVVAKADLFLAQRWESLTPNTYWKLCIIARYFKDVASSDKVADFNSSDFREFYDYHVQLVDNFDFEDISDIAVPEMFDIKLVTSDSE